MVVLVDSSVWINFFNGRPGKQADQLAELIADGRSVIGDLILVEVLQGYGRDAEYDLARQRLEIVPVKILGGRDVALQAAANYRFLRAKGVTVRKTIDMLIGTWCILNQTPLLHSDRDFDPLEQHLGLQVWRG